MHLLESERRVFALLLSDLAGGAAVPVDVDASARIFESLLERCDRDVRVALRAMMFAFDRAPILFAGWSHRSRYSGLSKERRLAYVEAIRTSPIFVRRSLLRALVAAVSMSHYGRVEVQRAVGYDAAHLGGRYREVPR